MLAETRDRRRISPSSCATSGGQWRSVSSQSCHLAEVKSRTSQIGARIPFRRAFAAETGASGSTGSRHGRSGQGRIIHRNQIARPPAYHGVAANIAAARATMRRVLVCACWRTVGSGAERNRQGPIILHPRADAASGIAVRPLRSYPPFNLQPNEAAHGKPTQRKARMAGPVRSPRGSGVSRARRDSNPSSTIAAPAAATNMAAAHVIATYPRQRSASTSSLNAAIALRRFA